VQEEILSSFDPSCSADLGIERMFKSTCCMCDSDPFEDIDADLGQAKGKVKFGPVTLTGSLPLCLADVIQYARECDLINEAQQFIDGYEVHLVDAEGRTNESTLVATQPKVVPGPDWDCCCRSAFYEVDVDVQIPAGSAPSFLVIPITVHGAKLPGQLVKGEYDCCSTYVRGVARFEIFGDQATFESNVTVFQKAIKTTVADTAGVSEDYVEVTLSWESNSSESRRLQSSWETSWSYTTPSFFLDANYTIFVPPSEEGLSVTLVSDRLDQASLDDITEKLGAELVSAGLIHTVQARSWSGSDAGGEETAVPMEEGEVTGSADAGVIVLIVVLVLIFCLILATLFKVLAVRRGDYTGEGAAAALPPAAEDGQASNDALGGEERQVDGEEEEVFV